MSSTTWSGSEATLVVVEPEAVGRPRVEPAGVLAHGRVAAVPDVRDDLGDPLRDVALRPVHERRAGCALEVLGHRFSSKLSPLPDPQRHTYA
jgi:hypothetical protein